MPHISHTRFVGVFRYRESDLKICVPKGVDQRVIEAAHIQRLPRCVPLECVAGPGIVGFACLRPIGGQRWRLASYAWCADGLARIVVEFDLAAGLSRRAPDAADRVGCLAEVLLIAAEAEAWRGPSADPDQAEHSLKDHAA